MLTQLQEKAVNIAIDGHSIVVTGQAGVGKTFLLKHVQTALENNGKKVATTASTGVASKSMKHGMTIHKWAGLEDGRHSNDKLAHLVMEDERFADAKKRIVKTDVLICDEISM